MNKKLYVGNLPYSATEAQMRTLFEQAGGVTSVVVITDRETGRSKGFGFVEMETEDQAQEAIRKFNGYSLNNRNLTVNEARPREERPMGSGDRPAGGARSDSGGYGGGRSDSGFGGSGAGRSDSGGYGGARTDSGGYGGGRSDSGGFGGGRNDNGYGGRSDSGGYGGGRGDSGGFGGGRNDNGYGGREGSGKRERDRDRDRGGRNDRY